MPRNVFRSSLLSLPPLVVLAVLACSSSTKKGPNGEAHDDWAGETRDIEITHEPCDPAGKEVRTFKGVSDLSSNKSFVTRVYDGGREVCSFADLNGDGNIDVFSYYDANGRLRRREAAYTVSKAIDEISIYENGDLRVVMRETNFDGKLDTWDYYEGGKLVRRERDKNGDGRLDEWWTFQPGTDNAEIVQADVRTGKPDPTQKVTFGLGAGALSGFGAGPTAPKDAGPEAAAEAAAPATPLPPAPEPIGAAPADAGTDAAPADAGAKKKGK